MTAWLSRWHMPDWGRAERITADVDSARLHQTASELIELVLDDNSTVLGFLPPGTRSQVVSCVEFLREAYDGDTTTTQFVAACLFVRRRLLPHAQGGPDELRVLVEALPV